jgi:hypothetical protein
MSAQQQPPLVAQQLVLCEDSPVSRIIEVCFEQLVSADTAKSAQADQIGAVVRGG